MAFGIFPPGLAAQLDGLTMLKRALSGEFPEVPLAGLLGFSMTEVEEGRVVFQGAPKSAHCNPVGTVHAGWTAAIMDSALASVVYSSVKPGEGSTTLEFKINCVRPVLPDMGSVTCEARLLHRGRTIATSEAYLRDANGKLLAHGTETCAIFPLEKK